VIDAIEKIEFPGISLSNDEDLDKKADELICGGGSIRTVIMATTVRRPSARFKSWLSRVTPRRGT